MTLVRLVCTTLALAAAACATPVRAPEPTMPTQHYRLCADPQFESMCIPASMTTPAAETAPIQIDINLSTPSPRRSLLG